MAMARIKEGSMDYVAGLSHLVGLGPHLPSSIIIGPMTQFNPDLGFGPYFACLDVMSILIQGALTAFSNEESKDLACYLECLYNFLLPTPRFYEIANKFELSGGPELLFKRHRFNSVLYHSDKTVREYARQCLSLLVERGQLKRKCETCGRQERSIAEFDCCSECR
jgi:hypothetical protein